MQSYHDEIISNKFCKLCGIKLPKMTRRNFDSFVCVCERNFTNPHTFSRDLIQAGVQFDPVTGEQKK